MYMSNTQSREPKFIHVDQKRGLPIDTTVDNL